MIVWRYRVIKNGVARRKWLLIVSAMLIAGLSYSVYGMISGEPLKKSAVATAFFVLFLFLYTIIVLGKPRYYWIDGDTVYYRPFKRKITRNFEVDDEKLLIKFKDWKLPRTLYFENKEDLENVKKYLKKKFEG